MKNGKVTTSKTASKDKNFLSLVSGVFSSPEKISPAVNIEKTRDVKSGPVDSGEE